MLEDDHRQAGCCEESPSDKPSSRRRSRTVSWDHSVRTDDAPDGPYPCRNVHLAPDNNRGRVLQLPASPQVPVFIQISTCETRYESRAMCACKVHYFFFRVIRHDASQVHNSIDRHFKSGTFILHTSQFYPCLSTQVFLERITQS